MTKVEWPNVVEAEDVICVAMRDKDRVEMLQIIAQCLLTKVCGGVNDDSLTGVFDQHRDTQAFVTRIVGRTCLARAGNRWDARGCAGA